MWSSLTRRSLVGALLATPVGISLRSAVAKGKDENGNGQARSDIAPSPPIMLNLLAFGGNTGIPDNSAALRSAVAALSALGGGTLFVGPGTYQFASVAVGQSGIALPSSITIKGRGRNKTILLVTGTSPCNLFVSINHSQVAIEDMTIVGNNIASNGPSVYGFGAAIRWVLDSTAKSDMTNFAIRGVHLENFGGPYWVDIRNDGTKDLAHEMRMIQLNDITFTSYPGNSIDPHNIAYNAAAICISGNSGAICNLQVSQIRGDARYIKTGIILYRHVVGARLDTIAIDNAGLDGATDDTGAYAIQLYDNSYQMSDITVANPIIRSPRSVGIYVAGGTRITIRNAVVSGQTDARAETLPKGAVVFNGTRQWHLDGGTFRDNWRDLNVVMPVRENGSAPTAVNGQVNDVVAVGSNNGILIHHADGYIGSGIIVRDCRWRTKTRTVLVQNSAGAVSAGPPRKGGYTDNIRFQNCHFEAGAGYRAMDLWGESGSAASGYVISKCILTGTNPLFAREQTGSLRIEGSRIRDLGTIAGTAAATLIGCPRINLHDCIFHSPGPNSVGIDLGGSEGYLRRLDFVGCTHILPPAVLPPQLGRSVPRFAGNRAQYVQDLEFRDSGEKGWICLGGTTWMGIKSNSA